MRRVIVNIVVCRVSEYPPWMTTEEIKEKVLERAKATYSDSDTSVSVGIVELPAEPEPQPTGD